MTSIQASYLRERDPIVSGRFRSKDIKGQSGLSGDGNICNGFRNQSLKQGQRMLNTEDACMTRTSVSHDHILTLNCTGAIYAFLWVYLPHLQNCMSRNIPFCFSPFFVRKGPRTVTCFFHALHPSEVCGPRLAG